MVKKHIPPRSESGMAATDVIGLDEADKKSSKKKEGKNWAQGKEKDEKNDQQDLSNSPVCTVVSQDIRISHKNLL